MFSVAFRHDLLLKCLTSRDLRGWKKAPRPIQKFPAQTKPKALLSFLRNGTIHHASSRKLCSDSHPPSERILGRVRSDSSGWPRGTSALGTIPSQPPTRPRPPERGGAFSPERGGPLSPQVRAVCTTTPTTWPTPPITDFNADSPSFSARAAHYPPPFVEEENANI